MGAYQGVGTCPGHNGSWRSCQQSQEMFASYEGDIRDALAVAESDVLHTSWTDYITTSD